MSFNIEKVLCHFSMTQDDFLNMCIVAGWDFQQNVSGVGIHTALKLVAKEDFLAVLQKNKMLPQTKLMAFKEQRQYSIIRRFSALMATAPWTPWPEPTTAEAFQNSCGVYLIIMWGVSNNILVLYQHLIIFEMSNVWMSKRATCTYNSLWTGSHSRAQEKLNRWDECFLVCERKGGRLWTFFRCCQASSKECPHAPSLHFPMFS